MYEPNRLWLLGLLVASVQTVGTAQDRYSPLARYIPVDQEEIAAAEGRLHDTFDSLGDTPPVATAAPLNERTVLTAATELNARLPKWSADLTPNSAYALGKDRWVVNFDVAVRGAGGSPDDWLPVSNPVGRTVILRNDGQPLFVRDRGVGFRIPEVMEPELSPENAAEIGRARAWEYAVRLLGDPPELVNTTPETELLVRGKEGVLCWTLLVRARDVRIPLSVRYWIDATSGRVAKAESMIFTAHHGRVVGSIWDESPLDGPKHGKLLHGVQVTRISSGDVVSTKKDGTFEFKGAATGRDLLAAALFGQGSIIMNDAGGEFRKEGLPKASQKAELVFHSVEEAEVAQVSAFYWTNLAFHATRDVMGNRLERIPVRVNLTNGFGNATWDGFALNFYRAGKGFPNTAYSTLVLHEYGHAVDGRLGGIQDRALSEGTADSFAVLLTKRPIIGKDLYGRGMHLRDVSQPLKWQAVQQPGKDPHEVGLVYAGFIWDLRNELKAANVQDYNEVAMELLLGAAKMNPKSIPDAVRLSFVADDDDGNLENGTPHFDQIAKAADGRGLPRPSSPPNAPQ